jgi:hypothetical protein
LLHGDGSHGSKILVSQFLSLAIPGTGIPCRVSRLRKNVPRIGKAMAIQNRTGNGLPMKCQAIQVSSKSNDRPMKWVACPVQKVGADIDDSDG